MIGSLLSSFTGLTSFVGFTSFTGLTSFVGDSVCGTLSILDQLDDVSGND